MFEKWIRKIVREELEKRGVEERRRSDVSRKNLSNAIPGIIQMLWGDCRGQEKACHEGREESSRTQTDPATSESTDQAQKPCPQEAKPSCEKGRG